MQSVIELGRVLRDRKTMPVKYPLPELIVIHTDQECLDDVKSLEVIFLLLPGIVPVFAQNVSQLMQ